MLENCIINQRHAESFSIEELPVIKREWQADAIEQQKTARFKVTNALFGKHGNCHRVMDTQTHELVGRDFHDLKTAWLYAVTLEQQPTLF